MVRKVGIDVLSFYTSPYYLDLAELAQKRGVEINKIHSGLGQMKMAVLPPDEDIVTLGANAAIRLLKWVDIKDIDHILFATESGFDCAKSAGMYVHKLLNLAPQCSVVELKQACYAGTAALQLGLALIRQNPKKKVLVIASDVSRYGLSSTGESSQGAAAVAMILSSNPRLLVVEAGRGLYADEVMDFWRPNYLEAALVEGKYSSMVYLRALEETWHNFQRETGRVFTDIDYFAYHTPVPRLVEKAHKLFLKINGNKDVTEEIAAQSMESFLKYARITGNSYTASLYVGLASLFDHAAEALANKRIGFYSYGSGCVAEYFTGVVQPSYRKVVDTIVHQDLLRSREALTYDEYEQFYKHKLPEDGSVYKTPRYRTGTFRLAGIEQHKRRYEAVEGDIVVVKPSKRAETKTKAQTICTKSPGKIILSGEHSVVYGAPALAFAVNRYAYTTITPQFSKMISLDLLSARYKESFAIKTLSEIKTRLVRKYDDFLNGRCGICDVLQTPFELAQFVVINFFDRLNQKMLRGLNIHTESTIPVGCGMGSSSAFLLSMVLAISRLFKIPLSEDKLLKLALEAERFQHGRSSGLDLKTSLSGGCLYFQDGIANARAVPKMLMYLVQTGASENTTGECVAAVRAKHGESSIWQEFGDVTRQIDGAVQAGNRKQIEELMRVNHRLLVNIGVVPERVQEFIRAAEEKGASAKVCGAGAIRGDRAGVVLVAAESKRDIQPICERYGYELSNVEIETCGLCVA